MLTAEDRERIRVARDADARQRAKRAARLDRSLEALARRDEMTATAEPAGRLLLPGDGSCKTENCPHEANDRYDRGPYAGLCVEVCIPRKREEMSKAAADRYRDPDRGVEWTAELVVDAILSWAREHGRFPRSSEWQRARNGEHRPTYDGVLRVFDGWRPALAAAGFPEGALIDDVSVTPDGSIVVRSASSSAGRILLPEPPEPEPDVEPEAEETESLAAIAERYEAAREEFAAAREALDEAAAALREHPVMAELLSGR